MFLWLGVEKWRDEKLFCSVEKKNEKIKNIVWIDLLSCSYYIILKKNYKEKKKTAVGIKKSKNPNI